MSCVIFFGVDREVHGAAVWDSLDVESLMKCIIDRVGNRPSAPHDGVMVRVDVFSEFELTEGFAAIEMCVCVAHEGR